MDLSALAATQLPDEAMNLQSRMLQAGAAATIETLWAVYDTSATMVAARFYTEWRGEPTRAPCEALAGRSYAGLLPRAEFNYAGA